MVNLLRFSNMEQKKVYIDVMGADGFFICQLRYNRRGRPMMVDGRIEEVYDLDEIRSFVYEKRPSLINRI